MPGASHQVHLVVDALSPEAQAAAGGWPGAAGEHRHPVIKIPPGVSYLVEGDDRPRLLTRRSKVPADAFVVEPLDYEVQPQLLVITPPGRRARVNGQIAPLVCLLNERDQFRLGDDVVLHMTIYNRPRIGPPEATSLGKECPVCRGPFEADSTVYSCWSCSAQMHAGGSDGRDCARVAGECSHCHKPVRLEEGYSVPPRELCGG